MPPTLNFLRRRKEADPHDQPQNHQQEDNIEEEPQSQSQPQPQHASSKPSRLYARLFRAALYLLALILLILVESGNIHDAPVLRQGWFLRVDLSDIIPLSVPDAKLINSIARSIGLHDFYQVGLWNFCEGYEDGSGITHCSKPRVMYAFDPIEIILNELLAGATIALPSDITRALDIARLASHAMFVLFLLAALLVFLCFVIVPLTMPSRPPGTRSSSEKDETTDNNNSTPPRRTRSPILARIVRLATFFLSFFAFLSILAASGVATALFTIFSIVFTNAAATELNVRAELGTRMLVYMWVAVAAVLVAFILQCRDTCRCCARCCAFCCCCCAGRGKKEKNRERKGRGFGRVIPGRKDMSEKDGNRSGEAESGSADGNGSHNATAKGAAVSEKPGLMHRLGRLRFS